MADSNQGVKIGVIVGLIIVGILIAVFIMSFGYLDYYQYGFKRQKSTSRVFTEEVYPGGRYLIGPDFEFKVYPATANAVTMQVTVFSSDTLEVYLNVQFQYFLRPQQLHVLHKKYQLTYDSVIRSSAMDALKAAAVTFTTEQFIKDRNMIENALRLAVKKRIGGKCCEKDCKLDTCLTNCIPLDSCTKEEDMGLMVTMRYFQLTRVSMPDKVYQRYLRALLLVEESQMEKYKLEEAVVKKEVDEAVETIGNQALEVAENATAEANLIIQQANAESLKIIGSMKSKALSILLTLCNITDENMKMSFHYLDSLGDNSKAHLAVDFNNYVVGGK